MSHQADTTALTRLKTDTFAVFKICRPSSIHVVDDVGLLEKLLVLDEVPLPVEPPVELLLGGLVQGMLRREGIRMRQFYRVNFGELFA